MSFRDIFRDENWSRLRLELWLWPGNSRQASRCPGADGYHSLSRLAENLPVAVNRDSGQEIARVLSVYKDDDETRSELNKLALPNHQETVEALLDCPRVSFSKFHALSLKALYRIVPHMEAGLRYDEA